LKPTSPNLVVFDWVGVTLYKIWQNFVKSVSIEIWPSWSWTNFESIRLSSPQPKFDCIGLSRPRQNLTVFGRDNRDQNLAVFNQVGPDWDLVESALTQIWS